MSWTTRPAGPDDWQDLKDLLVLMQNTKAKDALATTPASLWGVLCNQFQYPQVRLQVLVSPEGRVVGYACLALTSPPDINVPGASRKLVHCFIQSVFIDPLLPREAGLVMMEGIEDFARSGRATFLYGNVRTSGPIKGFARKYGMKPVSYQVGKEIVYDG